MRKYLYPFLVLVLLLIIGFQAYFDIKLRQINGAIIQHINSIESFVKDQFPDQVADFNKKNKQ